MPLVALVLLSLLSGSLHAAETDGTLQWRDSIRDIYIDGRLERNVQALTSSSPRMIAVVCGDEVLLLDPEKRTVARAPRAQFTFAADRTSASTKALASSPAGTLVQADPSTLLATVEGRTLLIASHQSKAGPMTIAELWETAPVWRSIADVYQPDGAIVERLRAIDTPVTLQVVLATWCGDSRQYVPRLLKSIAAAANPNVRVELTGIGPDFTTPMEVVVGQNITNVPTVIVRRGDRELGRFVETPAGATVESDVVDIVAGTPRTHPSRYERGAMLTSGTYLLRDGRKRHAGTERFELYERPGGGVVAHSVISRRDGSSVETWAARDSEGKPRFVEVTNRTSSVTRTRFRRGGSVWSATSRGASGGIVEQSVQAPETFVAPATITYAWARGAGEVFVVPESGVGVVRRLHVRVAEGDVPKSVKFEDGSSRTLWSAEAAPPLSDAPEWESGGVAS
ncbi:MAG: thioredoxin family protein, partial [Thermoanaerobaculia bacterium]